MLTFPANIEHDKSNYEGDSMRVNVTMVFNTPDQRVMCFDNVYAKRDYDPVEIAKASVWKKKRESSVDMELEEVSVNGELINIQY